jgi:1-acyl-sn-glycerol-3-phosphate acyltransferase
MHLSAIYTFAEFGIQSAAWLPAVALARGVTAGDTTHRIPGRMLRQFGRSVTRASMLWDVAVEGNIPGPGPYVVVANHASMADPFVLSFLPMDMRFVAKEELFRTPLVGWLLRLGGDIPLRRGDGDSARVMRAACVRTLARGLSVMIFPEGTRSRTGEVGAFRRGAFDVALEAGAPILPVALHGTAACVDGHEPRPARTRAEILAPIEIAGRTPDALETLRQASRDAIVTALDTRKPCERSLIAERTQVAHALL